MLEKIFSLLFGLSFILNERITATARFAAHTKYEFGFEKGGNYSIHLKDNSCDIVFGLITHDQLKIISKSAQSFEPGKFCGDSPSESITSIQKFLPEHSDLFLNGTIEEKGQYIPFYLNCGNSGEMNLEISYIFQNVKYLVDYRLFVLYIILPVFVGINGLIFIIWLINWILHCQIKIHIHYFFTCMLFFITMSTCSHYALYYVMGQTENYKGVQIFDLVIQAITMIVELLTFLLAAKGWCIISDTIKISEIVTGIIASVITVASDFIFQNIERGWWEYILIIAEMVGLVTYVILLFKAINKSSLLIRAHMLVIQNSGIDPQTTPILDKEILYNRFQYILITYLILIIARILISSFANQILWFDTACRHFSDAILGILVTIVFRLKGEEHDAYFRIIDGDVSEISLNDIEQYHDNAQNTTPWEPGIPLPPPPNIVSTVVLESPDGKADITVTNSNQTEEL